MPGSSTGFQTGVHGSRPAANAGCIHYSCTTHSLIYQSDGATWTTYATLGAAGGYTPGGTDVAVADGGTGSSTAAGAATNLGLGTGDSPQFTAINLGHASDTTITRVSAGVIAVEGVTLGAGAMTQLYDSTLGSPAASFDVSGISGSYNHLKLVLQCRSAKAAVSEDQLNMRFNNDSGSNYDSESIQAFDSTNSVGESQGSTAFLQVGNMPAASSGANQAAQWEILIANYAGTTFQKTFRSSGASALTTSTNGTRVWAGGGQWRNTAAVTRVTIYPNGGNFVTGSRLTIYGLL